jgi:hypothetical protein
MHRGPRTPSARAGWRSRLSLLASTLAISSALNAWIGGGTAALGAESVLDRCQRSDGTHGCDRPDRTKRTNRHRHDEIHNDNRAAG